MFLEVPHPEYIPPRRKRHRQRLRAQTRRAEKRRRQRLIDRLIAEQTPAPLASPPPPPPGVPTYQRWREPENYHRQNLSIDRGYVYHPGTGTYGYVDLSEKMPDNMTVGMWLALRYRLNGM